MGESEQHAQLVTKIVEHIRGCHGSNAGLSLLIDSRSVPPDRRPGRIGGFVPDIHCRTVPATFTIIGEAKSFVDFPERHTEAQLTCFLNFLRTEQQPELILAVPLPLVGAAYSLVRRIARRVDARHVPVAVLFG